VASPGSLSLLPISSPLRLAGLSFIESTSEAAAFHSSPRAVSILSLGSSLVLLCSGITQSQDLVLLLWDLRYSVILASHRFSIPAKLSTSKGSVSLALIPAVNTLALLSVSSGLLNKAQKTSSAVLAVPVTAPATSTIANAMGRASSSAKWLAKSDSLSNGHVPYARFDSDRRDLLDKLKAALRQKRPEAADSAFFEWLENLSGSAATVDAQHIEEGDHLFGHEFVREILDIVLQSPSKSAAALYPAKTVHHLLEKRVLSASMLSQSLLELLVERKDWVSGAYPPIRYMVLNLLSCNSAQSNWHLGMSRTCQKRRLSSCFARLRMMVDLLIHTAYKQAQRVLTRRRYHQYWPPVCLIPRRTRLYAWQ
jgi:hypothetical protein